MHEIVLTFVVEEMLKKLASLALEGVDLAWGLKGKLQKLNETLTFIRAVLHDAVERQGREESVKIWLQKLRDVAYKAEDALDEFGYEVLRQKVEGGTPSRKDSASADEFMKQLPQFDPEMAEKRKEAEDAGDVLRYVGVVDAVNQEGRVELRRPSVSVRFSISDEGKWQYVMENSVRRQSGRIQAFLGKS
ncbi:hypothetical protein Tsubulata_041569 [Turnera subulata]|uniref:Disease resistance N-terminal domain-containing protein n=1 Tax=Turnera subulata TaxID=218843 RepID=A0A9Q0FTU2_9ROSI|nr:hypothetical protein Tsubulata_041569 [Turnera subulata]